MWPTLVVLAFVAFTALLVIDTVLFCQFLDKHPDDCVGVWTGAGFYLWWKYKKR